MQEDYMVRGVALDGNVRILASRITNTLLEIRNRQDASPTAIAALGRLVCAAVMMGWDMKVPYGRLTLQVVCNGPIRGMIADADTEGGVRGYVKNPLVDLMPSEKGKIDVERAVGSGDLIVIKDYGIREPYVTRIPLISGGIALDIAKYYRISEQVPTAVALGVLANPERLIASAGGIIIQLMPGVSDEFVSFLEESFSRLGSVSRKLDDGMTPEEIVEELLGKDVKPEWLARKKVEFKCTCSREKAEAIILALGREEIKKMISEGKGEVECKFCNAKYLFDIEDLGKLLEEVEEDEGA
ncbi:MAG: Hsp33 family molecular chaperone HslO [Synergistetes bacterium]|nr:Hsp33 family molecular chaperone HslO [Synergistota bacterium]MDW8192906.1 Hsp33 family molecular chaperone HslO [Synergistota bacterium]